MQTTSAPSIPTTDGEYLLKHKVKIVTAASLFDGHDAAITRVTINFHRDRVANVKMRVHTTKYDIKSFATRLVISNFNSHLNRLDARSCQLTAKLFVERIFSMNERSTDVYGDAWNLQARFRELLLQLLS